MESPDTKKAPNLEDSGCVVDGLRSALCDGDMEDENSMMVSRNVNCAPFYWLIMMSNFWVDVYVFEHAECMCTINLTRGPKQSKTGHKFSAKHLISYFQLGYVGQ